MLQIVQAYDRRPIAEVEFEGAEALEAKLETAARCFRDRAGWLEPHERIGGALSASGLVIGGPHDHDRARRRAQNGSVTLPMMGVDRSPSACACP